MRETFRRNYGDWYSAYPHHTQKTRKDSLLYQSECVFVPLVIVDQAMEAMSRQEVSQQ